MNKTLLYISNGTPDGKIVLSKKSTLYKRLVDHIDYISTGFEMITYKSKFDFYDIVVLLLSDYLAKRKVPRLPKNLFVSEEELYRNIVVFGVEYKFIQGSDEDSEILLLIDLKLLVYDSIQSNSKISIKNITKMSEAYK